MALEELLGAIRPRALNVCRGVLPYTPDAEDACQDALISIASKIGSWGGRGRFTTWMHVVAVNAARSTYRRMKNQAVATDQVMLEQVLLNLMRNGIEAMRDSPANRRRLTIKLSQVDQQMEIRVIDRGPGIPPEVEEKLFTPLFSTKADGMGMGLNICRSIIEFHHGRLWVENNPEGGSIFVITLPIDRQ